MLEVKVVSSNGQHEGIVHIYGFDTLTPRAARAALQIAGFNTGTAWTINPLKVQTEAGLWEDNTARDYGYRVYRNTARKVYPDLY